MNDYKNYLVTLTPLGNFFFGGQKRTEVEKEKDYYIKSLYFPQQTVILGMLRHELLIRNHLFPLNNSNREQAVQLIGESSFDPGNPDQDFGVIRELSPVFIRKGSHNYHPAPKDIGLKFTLVEEGYSYFNHEYAEVRNYLPYFPGYKAKDERPDMLAAKDSPWEPLKVDDVFIPDEQVGIKKGKGGQTEEEAYYKQVFLRLLPGFAFAFYLRLKTCWDGGKKPIIFSDNLVFFGGERSAFRMDVEELPQSEKNISHFFNQTLPDFNDHRPAAVLTGDAFVDPGILNTCDFAFTRSVFFRNFRSFVRTTRKYWNLKDREDRETPFLGGRYHLLSRGSVLYHGNNPETVKQLTGLLDKPAYQKIGFNYYKLYPSKKDKEKTKE
jgi:CRISPR-associated protein Cmr3